jgi:hypothetical protein
MPKSDNNSEITEDSTHPHSYFRHFLTIKSSHSFTNKSIVMHNNRYYKEEKRPSRTEISVCIKATSYTIKGKTI